MSRYRRPRYRSLTTAPRNTWYSVLRRGLGYGLLGFTLSSAAAVGILAAVPPPTTAFMLQRHVDDWLENNRFRPIKQQWCASQQISRHAFAAVIASEDQKFYRHSGFDTDAIRQAYQVYQRGGKLRGASTISQQVAKNLFLTPARNAARKALEVWFTVLIETIWSKARILEVYLNIAEFGDHLFGIEAASRAYFGIPAKQLSRSQAALLAATLPNPLKLHADRPSRYLLHRRDWILRQMTLANS